MAETDVPDFRMSAPQDTPPVFERPPTLRPSIERPVTTSWPTVIGIICIVFGILGIFGGLCGIGGTIFQSAFFGAMPGMPDEDMAAFTDVSHRFMPLLIASNVVNMAVALLLTIGGFGLTSRRPWSRPALLHWSWIRMLGALAAAIITFRMRREIVLAMAEAMKDDPNASAPQGMFMMTGVVGGVQAVLTLLWGWALPVFNLIWFNRKRIRNEVATWA